MSRKRPSLSNKLDRLAEMDESGALEFFDMLEKDVEESIGFRYHAPRTQARQDHHLQMFYTFMTFMLRKPKDTPEEVMKVEAFPSDLPRLTSYLKKFLIFVFKNATPRSRATGETIQYRVLTQYRDSMVFWTMRILAERDEEVSRPKIYNAMTEAMRFVHQQYGKNKIKPHKTTVGLGELRQLIDYEMFHNICIENSEQHQVAWCIGRVLAVRPGTLGPSRRGRSEPIRWKNVRFDAGSVPGEFNVTITFPNIAIKAPQDPEVAQSRTAGGRMLEATIRSPASSDGLIFSVPHRLLVIALRRGILQDFSSIDELINGNLKYIRVKQAHLEDPIFYRSVPKGTSLDAPHPLPAAQLSSYLAARGLALGYDHTISFYSLRRKAASDLTRRVGADQARLIMGHDPETRTLERHYLALGANLDLSRVQMEESIEPGGVSTELLEQDAPLALSRLDDDALSKSRGMALYAYTNLLIRLDPDCPKDATPAQIKSYRKAMRRQAQREIVSKEVEVLRNAMTQDEFKGRVGALKASDFAKAIVERAQTVLSEPAPDPATVGPIADDGEEDDGGDDEEGQEEDLEDSAGRGEVSDSLFVAMDEESVDEQVRVGSDKGKGKVTDSDIQFKDLVSSFMHTLMENTLTTYTGPWNKSHVTCPMCQDDGTVSALDKAKAWLKPAHLERHMSGTFHSLKARWERRMKRLHDLREQWLCPYCTNSRPFPSLGDVVQHIKNSSKTVDVSDPEKVRHERLKDEDGWFDPEWAGTITKERQLEREREAKRSLKDVGLEFVDDSTTERVPVPGIPGAYHGGPANPMTIPSHLEHILSYGEPQPYAIPPHLAHVLSYGEARPYTIPPHLEHALSYGEPRLIPEPPSTEHAGKRADKPANPTSGKSKDR